MLHIRNSSIYVQDGSEDIFADVLYTSAIVLFCHPVPLRQNRPEAFIERTRNLLCVKPLFSIVKQRVVVIGVRYIVSQQRMHATYRKA